MPKLNLKKDFQDGQILHGVDLNSTNMQVETAFNNMDDSVQEISEYIQEILPDSKEYTDEQIEAAVQDFSLTEVYKKDIAELEESIAEVRTVSDNSFDRLNTFVNLTFINSQDILLEQTDGRIESFFQEEEPTFTDKSEHNGDMWFKSSTKELKRYSYSADEWDEITNQPYIDAYENASNSVGAEDGLITTFVTIPTPPYNIGDLFPGSSASTLKICKNQRATGEYSESDWQLANIYTDDTSLNYFIDNNYADLIQSISGETYLYYSYNDPSINWNTDEQKDIHVGSLWRDRNTEIIYRYDKNEDEYSWQNTNIQSNLFDIIDGKKTIHTRKPTKYEKDDIWIIEPALEDLLEFYKTGDILTANKNNTEFSWDDWDKKVNAISQETINAAIEPIVIDLNNVINDLDLNNQGSKLSRIVQSISSVTTSFQIKGGANLISDSLLLFNSINSNIFEKTGVWETRQSQQISENTASKFMTYCTSDGGKIKWVIKTIPNTAYTISIIYSNEENDVSTLKLTNGNQTTLIDDASEKSFEYFEYGFVSNSNEIIIELETTGNGFGYSDLMLNYGAIIEENSIEPNALKWQPAPGESFGSVIKMSYEGMEVTMKNGLFKHIQDNSGERIILVATGEIVTELDETGLKTTNGLFKTKIEVGNFTQIKIDDENQIEY